jgi:hypothetical protein
MALTIIAAKRRTGRTQIVFECTVRDVAPRRAIATPEADRHHDVHRTAADAAVANLEGLDFCSYNLMLRPGVGQRLSDRWKKFLRGRFMASIGCNPII